MRVLTVAVCLFSFAGLAQEIGTEIQPGQVPATTAQPPTTYDNPYAPPPAEKPLTPPPEPPKASASGPRKGAFGLRAGFGGGGLPVLSTGAGAVASAPTIGIRYLVQETLALDVDAGLGMGLVSGNAYVGFGLGLGVNAYMGSPGRPVRPFVGGAIGMGKLISGRGDDFFLSVAAGGGGEYWFADHFSVYARGMVGLSPILFSNSSVPIVVATFTPGLGATVYF